MKYVWKKIMIAVMLLSFIAMFAGCGKEESKSGEEDISISGVTSDFNEQSQEKDKNKNEKESGGIKLAKDTDRELAPYLIRAQAHGTDLYGYVDIRSGEFVIEPQFTKQADPFFNRAGWTFVAFPDKSSMIINTKGEYLVAPEDFSDGAVYENGINVVIDKEETKVSIYRDADFVKELEVPEGCVKWSKVRDTAGLGKGNDKYTPSAAIAIIASNTDGKGQVYWYDFDGNFLYQGKVLGSLAVEEDKMYYFGDSAVTIMDRDGNVLETLDIGTQFSRVYSDGTNWYVVAVPNYGPNDQRTVLYTNGFKEVFPTKNIWSYWASLLIEDDIYAVAGVYYKLDGTIIYDMNSAADTGYYSFSNGYAKINDYMNGQYGFIDTEGKFVLELTEDEMEHYGNYAYPGGLIPYEENGLWGVKNMQENVVWEPAYPSLGE